MKYPGYPKQTWNRAMSIRHFPFSDWILFSINTKEAKFAKGWNIMQEITWENRRDFGLRNKSVMQQLRGALHQCGIAPMATTLSSE
jgi:hypothetical protein